MQSPAEILNEQIRVQAAMQPSVQDQSEWQTRYIFVPFRDRPFSTDYIQEYCGLRGLKAGTIILLQRGYQDIPDYDQIGKVPKGLENRGPWGLTGLKRTEKSPAQMLESLLQTFNPHHGTDPQQDNGIDEIPMLRGQDVAVIRDVQDYCLPALYATAREQIAQLTKAVANPYGDVPDLFIRVAERLLDQTERAKTWATWHRDLLEAAMEDRANTGKDRVSPLDRAVCAWLELPEPRFRSQMAQPMVQTAAASIPQIWCGECGAYSNYGPQGEKPKGCVACRTPFEATGQVVESLAEPLEVLPASSPAETALERRQRELREKNAKK